MYYHPNPEETGYNSAMNTIPPQTDKNYEYDRFLQNQIQEERMQKQERRLYQIEMNKKYMSSQQAFPFGNQSTKISNYVVNQMNKDEENKRILEKFRLDAIKHRNQKYIKHIGTLPYLTESMLPGTNVDASKFIERPPPQKISYPQLLRLHHHPPHSLNPSPIKKYHTIQATKKSIGVQTDESEFTRPRKIKIKKQIIQEDEQEAAMKRIKKMLKGISSKLRDDTEQLYQSMKKSNVYKTPKYKSKFFTESVEEQSEYEEKPTKPTIKYSPEKMRLKTESLKNNSNKPMLNIKNHLKLLKKNRKRLDELNRQGSRHYY